MNAEYYMGYSHFLVHDLNKETGGLCTARRAEFVIRRPPKWQRQTDQTSQTVTVTHQNRWQPQIGVSHRAGERIWATKAQRPVKHTPLASSCSMLLDFLIPSCL